MSIIPDERERMHKTKTNATMLQLGTIFGLAKMGLTDQDIARRSFIAQLVEAQFPNVELIGWQEDYSEEDFEELHRNHMGGSAAGVVRGVDTYTTLFAAICGWQHRPTEKAGKVPAGKDPRQWGHVFEDGILTMCAKTHPEWAIVKAGCVLRDKTRPWRILSVDAFIIADVVGTVYVLDAKNVGVSKSLEWGTDEEPTVPKGPEAQVVHYMSVLGPNCKGGVLYACVGGQSDRFRFVPRDEGTIAYLDASEDEVWDVVQSGEMPNQYLNGKDATTAAIKAQHPEHILIHATKLLNSDADKAVSAYLLYKDLADDAKEKLDKLNEQVETQKNELRIILGDYKEGTCSNGYTVSNAWQNGGWSKRDDLTQEEEEGFETFRRAYMKQARFPVLRVKMPRTKK